MAMVWASAGDLGCSAGHHPKAVDRDPPLRIILGITAWIGLSVGLCFFVMLVAIARVMA